MHRRKQLIASALGVLLTALGTWLRLNATEIAWPRGLPEGAVWGGIEERAYQDLGLGVIVLGLAVVLAVLVNWLWTPSGGKGS